MNHNIGIVGAGNISDFHIDALLKANFKINGICGRNNSVRAAEKAKFYGIPFFSNVDELIKKSGAQSYLVCVDPISIDEVLSSFKEIELPLLIEKPGPLSFEFINKNWFVAYNRRFYQTINILKRKFLSSRGFLDFEFVEFGSFKSIQTTIETLNSNTIHGIDLIRFIVGDFNLVDFRINNEASLFEARILDSDNLLVGRLTIVFGAPSNTSIRLFCSGEIFHLKPLELLTKFNNLEIVEPSAESKIRRYKPTWVENSDQVFKCDFSLKPGFFEQALAFKNHVASSTDLCSIEENFKNLELLRLIAEFIKKVSKIN